MNNFFRFISTNVKINNSLHLAKLINGRNLAYKITSDI